MKEIEIYCDGSCLKNPGPGGWAALLISGDKKHEKLISGGTPESTNNRMELTAAIEGLKALRFASSVTLYSDSKYVITGMTEWMAGWQKKGMRNSSGKIIENIDLWQALLAESSRHKMHWKWVKGHAGHPLNERVDEAARNAALKYVKN